MKVLFQCASPRQVMTKPRSPLQNSPGSYMQYRQTSLVWMAPRQQAHKITNMPYLSPPRKTTYYLGHQTQAHIISNMPYLVACPYTGTKRTAAPTSRPSNTNLPPKHLIGSLISHNSCNGLTRPHSYCSQNTQQTRRVSIIMIIIIIISFSPAVE